MPNWCSGNIRFRGSKENIYDLLKNEIVFCTVGEDAKTIEHPIASVKSDLWGDVEITPSIEDENGWYYIKDTKRAFLGEVNIVNNLIPKAFCETPDKNIFICVFDNFSQAWCIKPEDFVNMSKKYDVDIHIFGWEQGLCFSQEIEIIRGEVTKDIYNDYKNGKSWDWDCPMSYIGG